MAGHFEADHSLSDPNVSEKAKRHARDVLEAEGEEVGPRPEQSPPSSPHDQHTKRVLAGYKAALRSTSFAL